METNRRREPLILVPMFAQASPEQRRQIEATGVRRLVKRGKHFFREGQASTGLHILLSGQLKAVRELPGGAEILMHFVQAGDIFGEVPALLASRYSASAVAVEDSEIFTLPLPAFTRLIAQAPEAGLLFMRSMAKKLSVLLERIEAQKSLRTEQRIARSILAKHRGGGKPGEICSLGMSKKLWAEELGVQPETLSRGLRLLTQDGIIVVRGRDISLCDPLRLARVAAGDSENAAREQPVED